MPIQARTGIKSIQRGVLTFASADFSVNATISAVDPAKTQIRMIGQGSGVNDFTHSARLWLNSSTQIGAVRTGTGGSLSVTYEVTEWY